MTDWLDDLKQLTKLCEQPESCRPEAAGEIVAGFLFHATAHVMEASRLLVDYEPGYLFDSPKPRSEKP